MENKIPHVLLVEDDEINQLVACTFLKKWNVAVTIAKDGRQALNHIKTKAFQLVMMDLHMPEMDGDECTRQIRAMEDPYFREVPIILFSASGTFDSKQHARKMGMTDFMSKPFRQEDLREKLIAYIPLPDNDLRPLHIDFDVHTAGDPSFKKELLHLLVENIEEFRRSLDHSLTSGDASGFQRISHKVTSAFILLNDPELSVVFSQLKTCVSRNELKSTEFKRAAAEFKRIGLELTRSMQHEIESIEKNPAKIPIR